MSLFIRFFLLLCTMLGLYTPDNAIGNTKQVELANIYIQLHTQSNIQRTTLLDASLVFKPSVPEMQRSNEDYGLTSDEDNDENDNENEDEYHSESSASSIPYFSTLLISATSDYHSCFCNNNSRFNKHYTFSSVNRHIRLRVIRI